MGRAGRPGNRVFLGVLCSLIVLAGCSSASRDTPKSVGLAVGSTTVVPGASGGAVTNDPNATNASPGAVPDAPSTTRQGAASRVAATPAAGVPARSTAGDIKVGLLYVKAGETLPGTQGYALVDGLAAAKIVIDYINRHGGFGGRRVQLSTYGMTLAELAANGSAHEQAACAKFTEDDKVFMAVQVAPVSSNYAHCLVERGVVWLEQELFSGADSGFLSQHPDLVYQLTPVTERLGRSLADSLVRRGYPGRGANVGVVYTDSVFVRPANTAFLSGLAAAGIKPKPDNVVAADGSQSKLQNTVLKFRSDNVTHVVLIGSAASGFMNVAVGQGYFPRYGLLQIPLELTALNTPAQALDRALSLGYEPTTDVEAAQEGTPNAAARQCLQIMKDGGITPGSRIADTQLRYTCDTFFWIKASADRAQQAGVQQLTRPTLRSAVEALGATFAPAANFGTLFGASRHDGGELYKDVAFNSQCRCFEYQGAVRHFS